MSDLQLAALQYVRQGLRVLPLATRGKEPLPGMSIHDATTDAGLVKAWWDEWPDANVGIVPDDPWVGVDVDLVAVNAYRQLARAHGDNSGGETACVVTGSGGAHLYYRLNGYRPIEPSGNIVRGLEVRGAGRRYLVAPPSIHPNGSPYTWRRPLEAAQHVPHWLLDALTDRQVEVTGGEVTRPIRQVSAALTQALAFEGPGGDVSAGDFAVACHAIREGYDDAEAAWLVLEHAGRFRSPKKRSRGPGYAHLTVARAHGEAESELEETMTPTADDAWAPRSLLDVGNAERLKPELLGLFYPGVMHIISGPTESLKSWLAMIACLASIREGNTAWYIDYEMSDPVVASRFRALGATDEELGKVAHITPQGTPFWAEEHKVLARLEAERPAVIVVDAMTGAMESHDLDDNKTREVERLLSRVFKRLAQHGATVLVLDHVGKTSDASNSRYAIGSQRKISGTEVHFGMEMLTALKDDQSGNVRIHNLRCRHTGLPYPVIGNLTLSPAENDGVDWDFQFRKVGVDRASPAELGKVMEETSQYLEQLTEPCPRWMVEKFVRGRAVLIRQAMDQLLRDGFAEEVESARTSARCLVSVKPFRVEEAAA